MNMSCLLCSLLFILPSCIQLCSVPPESRVPSSCVPPVPCGVRGEIVDVPSEGTWSGRVEETKKAGQTGLTASNAIGDGGDRTCRDWVREGVEHP